MDSFFENGDPLSDLPDVDMFFQDFGLSPESLAAPQVTVPQAPPHARANPAQQPPSQQGQRNLRPLQAGPRTTTS
eukprot:CAMPEP_0185839712 /NCGR_PEP_ID=MMETSP1353-20130828/15037_1 /TAXON_ID=1077150 /ORGANISM="Erythrolobus australicus, Strain CCMP3124" /LENGTH=74 /DNA_ID=CAMNT_0028538927 /DNA_START=103 /DNA_END=324 /DNA_ORIENTATION=+